MMTYKKSLISLCFGSALVLSGCEPGPAGYSSATYYDSMMWNDYYYGASRPGYRPAPNPPNRPDRPGGGIDPGFSRPPAVNLPSHRPSGGGGFRR